MNNQAALKVNTALTRMTGGNFGQTKSVGKGVQECRIDHGPGYRVYFGRKGDELIILLGGGTKKKQQQDIEEAHALWKEYKARMKALSKKKD